MYYYLVASLPDLTFGRVPAMDVAGFDALCAEQLTPGALAELVGGTLHVSREPGTAASLPAVYAEYTRFEQYLRTRIAERRTGRDEERGQKLPDPETYYTDVDALLGGAAALSDPLEREKAVDRIRWRKLDELEAGHEFDFDKLCVYRLKLAVLDKYRKFDTEKGHANFNAAVDRISGIAPADGQEEK